jgi:hypothetical protein
MEDGIWGIAFVPRTSPSYLNYAMYKGQWTMLARFHQPSLSSKAIAKEDAIPSAILNKLSLLKIIQHRIYHQFILLL